MDLSAVLLRLSLDAPVIVALIYLVLKLDDKHQEAIKALEENNQKIIDSLLKLINDLSSTEKSEEEPRK